MEDQFALKRIRNVNVCEIRNQRRRSTMFGGGGERINNLGEVLGSPPLGSPKIYPNKVDDLEEGTAPPTSTRTGFEIKK